MALSFCISKRIKVMSLLTRLHTGQCGPELPGKRFFKFLDGIIQKAALVIQGKRGTLVKMMRSL